MTWGVHEKRSSLILKPAGAPQNKLFVSRQRGLPQLPAASGRLRRMFTMKKSVFWQRSVLLESASIHEAIERMNETATQIVLVASPDGILKGTVTDGDIRRGLLAGMSLSSPLIRILHRDALVAPPQMSWEDAIQLMRANRIHQLPVVDDQRRIVGLHLLNDLIEPDEKSNRVVIMAGGRGTRLLPHTESCPKPLLPVAGKPILEHILTRAREDGFRNFLVSIHYLGGMIKEHFGDGSHWGVRIEYVEEIHPLGTAGALSLIQPKPSESLVVTNGDILTDIRYRELLEFHQRHGATATMAARLHEWQQPYGVVETRGMEIVGFVEKPIVKSRVNAGIYVLEPSALESLVPGEFCDMPMLFQRLQKSGARTIVYPMHEPWVDIGRPEDFSATNSVREINKLS